MGDPELFQALQPFNTHWKGAPVSGLVRKNPGKRRAFAPLAKRARRLPFHVLVGPRQVGKTTLIGHIVADLLESGTPPEHVLYILADSPQVSLELGGHLEPAIRCFERLVLRKSLEEIDGPAYVFIDELHTLPHWDRELKSLYDRYHPYLRVFASGSSSATLSQADLPGRVDRSEMYPMKFAETLEHAAPQTRALLDQARNIRHAVNWRGKAPEIKKQLSTALAELHVAAQPYLPEIMQAQDAYITRGGYPGSQPPLSDAELFAFFETAVNTVLSKDVAQSERVRKPDLFRSFLAQMARDHGGKFAPTKVAKDLGLDAATPTAWVELCERMFLLRRLEALGPGLKTLPRKADKIYVQDPGLLNYLAGGPSLADLLQSGKSGLVMEGILFDHLRRLQFNAYGGRSGTMGYIEKPEADFIVQLPSTHLAIESKFSRSPKGRQRLATQYANEKNVLSMLVTQSSFSIESEAWEVPSWLLLMTA